MRGRRATEVQGEASAVAAKEAETGVHASGEVEEYEIREVCRGRTGRANKEAPAAEERRTEVGTPKYSSWIHFPYADSSQSPPKQGQSCGTSHRSTSLRSDSARKERMSIATQALSSDRGSGGSAQ